MRRARIRTTHASEAVARVVAGALEPDNTDSMTTRVEGDAVVTTIDRETTGGLHASVDDYVVNLHVADRLAGTAGDDRPGDGRDDIAHSQPNANATNTDTDTTTTHE